MRKPSGQSMHHCTFPDKARRKADAEVRNAEYAKLSVHDRLTLLDAKLGKGVGATKQRAKLSKAKS